MRLFHHDTHNISAHYLPSLINGDYSGLNDSDELLIEDYLKRFEGFYITYTILYDHTDFRKCEISGLLSDCYLVDIHLQPVYKDDEVNYINNIDMIIYKIEKTDTPRHNSVTGYGSKLPTQYLLHCSDGYKRRVYARCYSNVASLYIVVQGKEFYLHDYQL